MKYYLFNWPDESEYEDTYIYELKFKYGVYKVLQVE